MSLLAEAVRPSWLHDIHRFTGNPRFGFRSWLTDGNYQFYTDVTNTATFTMNFADELLIEAIAYDINRFFIAAVESIADANPSVLLPKSAGWLGIRSYYAAFFSALAVLRTFGIIATRIEPDTAATIADIASAYGAMKVAGIDAGWYVVEAKPATGELLFTKKDLKGGVHAGLWLSFKTLLDRLGNEIISRSAANSPDRNVVAKFDAFSNALSLGGRPPYWLTDTRNAINYKLAFEAWYPYGPRRRTYVDQLYRACKTWLSDPMSIDIDLNDEEDLRGFMRSCAFVVAMSRVILADIEEHCPDGTSFVHYGASAILSHIGTAA